MTIREHHVSDESLLVEHNYFWSMASERTLSTEVKRYDVVNFQDVEKGKYFSHDTLDVTANKRSEAREEEQMMHVLVAEPEYILIVVPGYVARAGIEEEAGLVRQEVNSHVWAAILHAGDLAMSETFAVCWTQMVARVFPQDKVPRRHQCDVR